MQLLLTYSTSCLDRCNHRDTHTCQCDAECELFGDCCADFQTHCQVNQELKETVNYKNLSVCTEVYHNDEIDVGYIISKCPSSWTEPVIRSKCSSHSINVHVYDKEGYNYRNIFCALCHNRTIADISFWDFDDDLVKECPTDLPNYERALVRKKISPLRGEIFRRCLNSEKCPQTFCNGSIINACDSYVYPVYACLQHEFAFFRNPHCAFCNGYDVSILQQLCGIFEQQDFLGAEIWQFRTLKRSAASFSLTCPDGEIC